MGLDISAYRKLVPVRPRKNEDDDGYEEKLVSFRENMNFPGRIEGIEEHMLYRYAERHGFRAGSYGGYNRWREWLASLVGTSPKAMWANPQPGPFSELINFSDCEGVLGPKIAAKLAKDFAEYDKKARSAADPADSYDYELYQHWRKAMELAADGGAVDFH